jgi:hypothetical protein
MQKYDNLLSGRISLKNKSGEEMNRPFISIPNITASTITLALSLLAGDVWAVGEHIKINKAVIGHGASADVTQEVADFCDDKIICKFDLDGSVVTKDPVPLVVKTTTVAYSCGDRRSGTVSALDQGSIMIDCNR